MLRRLPRPDPASPGATPAGPGAAGSGSSQELGGTPADDPAQALPAGASRRTVIARRRSVPRRSPEPASQARRIGGLSLLLPPRPAGASPLVACLQALEQQWRLQGHQAALWRAWPAIAGPQLAPHCRPLALQAQLLTVGAAPGPWLQALQYNRLQLLGSLRAAGFPVRDLRFRQCFDTPLPPPGSALEADAWALHPSRADVHGQADCPRCGCPAPAGEMARWGHCSFCRRQVLAAQAPASAAAAGPDGTG